MEFRNISRFPSDFFELKKYKRLFPSGRSSCANLKLRNIPAFKEEENPIDITPKFGGGLKSSRHTQSVK